MHQRKEPACPPSCRSRISARPMKVGFEALKDVSLDIADGEVLALLGPNGAGKTTLISIICGIAVASSGRVEVDGHDTVDDYRAARSLIGLVPQEINLEPFETVMNNRQLFARTFRQAQRQRISRKDPAPIDPMGQEGHADQGIVRRHETSRSDRQGAQPRAARPVSGRADGRRRCRNCAATCGRR